MATWVSKRIARTSAPIVVSLAQVVRNSPRKDVLSLAQGVVHWAPPNSALKRVQETLGSPTTSAGVSRYGPDEGNLELREKLYQRLLLLASSNKTAVPGNHIIMTQGANQAIFSTLLTATDVKDSVGLLVPFYFNHHMALTALDLRVNLIQRTSDMHVDEKAIETAVTRAKLRALILTNPCNPTGTVIPQEVLERIQKLCQANRCTLIVDNTYRDFVYQGDKMSPGLVFGPNVYNVFSMSKNYGLAGWRIGYVHCPSQQSFDNMIKVQDTVVICPTQVSQQAALGALECEEERWVETKVESLKANEQAVRGALERSGAVGKICGGEGSIFLFAKLSKDESVVVDDYFAVQSLVERFGVAVLPGSACGMEGWIRVSFANLEHAQCAEASSRLELGLKTLDEEASRPKK